MSSSINGDSESKVSNYLQKINDGSKTSDPSAVKEEALPGQTAEASKKLSDASIGLFGDKTIVPEWFDMKTAKCKFDYYIKCEDSGRELVFTDKNGNNMYIHENAKEGFLLLSYSKAGDKEFTREVYVKARIPEKFDFKSAKCVQTTGEKPDRKFKFMDKDNNSMSINENPKQDEPAIAFYLLNGLHLKYGLFAPGAEIYPESTFEPHTKYGLFPKSA